MHIGRIITVALAACVALWAPPAMTGAQEEDERIAEARTSRAQPPLGEPRVTPRSQPARNFRLSGRYVLARPVEAAREDMEEAISRAVADMNFFIRGFGADRLRETNPIRRNMRTEVVGDRITISYGDASYTTRDGVWQTVREPSGNEVELRQRVMGDGRIEQIFRSPDGTKLTVYDFSERGDNVMLSIVVRSPRLPEPLRYQLSYRRR